jgi:molecular chaperone DnaK (HSP70)
MPMGQPQIDITFDIDVDNVLRVKAIEKFTGTTVDLNTDNQNMNNRQGSGVLKLKQL